jgi:dipeptidyl-peptidase-4
MFAAALLLPSCLHAQQPHPITVEDIWGSEEPGGTPPQQIQWSPDGGRVTFLSSESDLMQLAPTTGALTVLVSHTRLSALAESSKGKSLDGRTPTYRWAPDSKHIVFESLGQLLLYSLENGTAVDVASTGLNGGGDPKFSPNGQFLSYIRNHNLYLHHFKDQSESALASTREEALLNGEVDWVYGEELNVTSNYFWSPDSLKIAYLQMDEAPVPEYPITDWIPVHAALEKQRYPQAGDPNPRVRLGVVKVQGGKTVWIKLPIDSGNDYVPRFGWVDASTLWIETVTRDHKHRSIYFADVQHGDTKLAYTEADEKYLDASYDVYFTSTDFFLISWRDGHSHIYRYGFDRGNPMGGPADVPVAHLLTQVTHGDFEVTGIAALLDNSQTIYYVSTEGAPRERQVWSVKTDGSARQRISTTAGVHEPLFAPLSPTFVDSASDRSSPPVMSLCHGSECKAFWKSSLSSGFSLTTSVPLELSAADGKTILYADLVMPPGSSPASVPLITNPYGGPGIQTAENFPGVVTDENLWGSTENRMWDELLVEHGFAVLHVSGRGMAGRGRDFEQACYRNFGPVQLEDQLAAIDQVLAKYPQLDRNRLGWWGWSWGGTFTLNALSHSDRFRAGVAVAPVTDWRNYDSIYTERYMGMPAENPEGYREQSPVNSAKSLKGHLLLMHGTGDDNVHFANSIQYVQKLIDAGIPYDLQLFPRKTHSISGAEARRQLYSRILLHFETYLKNDAESRR